MPWAECCRATAVALLLIGSVSAAPADPPAYGKVDTFEPGKKYNCVPTADRKSWDCTQAGKVTREDTPPPAPRHDEPAPVAAAAPAPPVPATPPPQSAPTNSSHTGKLPSYLLAPGASDHATQAPAAPAPAPATAPAKPAEPVAAPEVHTSTNPQPAPAAQPAPAPAQEAAPKPAPESPKPVASEPASAPPAAAAPTPPVAAPTPRPPAPAHAADRGGDFLELSGEQYVIELARGDQASIAAAHAALSLPHGQAYELHLRQNGSDTWLLVWGSFDDVGAAREARGELPADAHAGWPRRVAPLQAEVRRAQE
jgi:hypothetical protein